MEIGSDPAAAGGAPDHPVARLLRILFSVVVSLVAALMVASSLWSPVDGHYLHRAAAPLFALGFGFPIVLGIVAGMTGVFFWLDRRAFRVGGVDRKVAVVVVSLCVAGTLAGYVSALLGAIFLFLLFYWLLTGRVAGRPGWSLRHFQSTRWDEKVYAVVMAVFCGAVFFEVAAYALAKVVPAGPGTPAFRVEHPHHMNAGVERALARFPDAQSCLERGADASRRADLMRMDWDRIETDGDATVCAFRPTAGERSRAVTASIRLIA